MTFKDIQTANSLITTTDVKGKEYAEVNQRIKAFRSLIPEGTIETEILSISDGVVIMKATVRDADGKVLGTGTAYEKESSSFINKTSYIENCETSAVGRALGMLGIGIDTSLASAEEVANAINNQTEQTKPKPIKKSKNIAAEPVKAESQPAPAEPVVEIPQQFFNRKCEYCGKDVAPETAMESFEKIKGHIFCSPACVKSAREAIMASRAKTMNEAHQEAIDARRDW